MSRAASALALLLLPAIAAAQAPPPATLPIAPGGLTADEVARRAVSTSYEVVAAAEQLRGAAAQVDQAMAPFFPRLSLVARYTRLSAVDLPNLGNLVFVPPNTPTGPVPAMTPLLSAPVSFPVPLDNGLFQASLNLPLSDYILRFVQGLAAARHGLRAASLGEKAARLKAATDGRLLFYGWVRALGQLVVTDQAVALSRSHLADVQHMYEAGVVSRADVMRVDSQVAQAELVATRVRNLVAITEEQLRIAMRDPPQQRYALGEDLLADLPALPPGGDVDRRLELRALDETVEAYVGQAKSTRAGYFPRLDAFGDAVVANPNQRIFPLTQDWRATWDVGVQLSWTPNDTGVAWAAVRAAEAKAAEIRAQRGAAGNGIHLEATQAELAMREADQAVVTATRGLRSAEESYRVRRELFKNGKATSVELSDAEIDLTRARLEALNARVDQRVARTKLIHATARDVD